MCGYVCEAHVYESLSQICPYFINILLFKIHDILYLEFEIEVPSTQMPFKKNGDNDDKDNL